MLNPITTQVLVLITLYAVFWQAYKLRRRLSGFAHGALLVFIGGTVLPQIAAVAVHAGWLPTGVGSIVGDVAVTVPVVALFCFRLGLEKRGWRDPRVVVTIASGVGISLITVALGVISVHAGAPLQLGGDAISDTYPSVVASIVLNSIYRMGLIFWVGLWVFPFTKHRGTPRHMRIGMRVAAVGFLAMGCVVAAGLVNILAALVAGRPLLGSLLPLMIAGEIIAGVCWALGLSYPLIASRIAARRAARGPQQRALQRTAAFWAAAVEAFPEIRRPEPGGEPIDVRLGRRQAECYDCLHHLRLYADRAAAASSRAAAELLESVLERYETDHDESVWSVIDRNRDAGDADQEMQLLVDLSELVAEQRAMAR